MSWTNSGINWENPGPGIPMWTCFIELAKAINERHHLTGRQRFDIVDFPLIAFNEEDNYANSSISRGNRQYKLFQHLNRPFEGFQSMSKFGPVGSIYQAIGNELRWDYSRTDLESYIVDEDNSRTRNEMTNFGFPQAWDHAPTSSGFASDIAFIEALYPACNSIWTRIDTNDSSLYDSAGLAKREAVTELWELLKAFKYVNHFYGRALGSFENINLQRTRTVNNQDPTTYNSAWAATPDGLHPAGCQMQLNHVSESIMHGSVRNSDLVTDWGSFGLSTPPEFVTNPRHRIFTDFDGSPAEVALSDGFYDLGYTVEGAKVIVHHYITADGQSPASVTIPNQGDNLRTRSIAVASGGSSVSQNGMVYDLTTVAEQMDYPADGT